MSLRTLGAIATSLFSLALFASPAEAKKPCQCEVSVGCPKDGHTTLVDFGAVDRYREIERRKQSRCATTCGARAASATADIRADADLWCGKLGEGRHPVAAYSVVGHRDTRNNWCDPDHTVGTLVCEEVCACPPGFNLDPDTKLCVGTCGGRAVVTFNLGCDLQARWE